MSDRYPLLEVNLDHLRCNVQTVVSMCNKKGIDVCGVIKGASGIPEIANEFYKGGCKQIASSRLYELEDAMNFGIPIPRILIRIPMLSEVEDVIRIADYSLNSELDVIIKLNEEAKKRNKIHNVILMADLGDLREGYFLKDEIVDVAIKVENELKNIHLSGVGVNLGCYGSVVATKEKLEELVDIAEEIEKALGRKLEIISGGATSSFMRVLDSDIPERVNHLRIGELILLAHDLETCYGYDLSKLYKDVFRLKAEVIEVKIKASYPRGELGVDAFGRKPTYIDRGTRKRALIGIGRVDYASIEDFVPEEDGIEVLGGSSDHTILDIEDYKGDLKVGDILTFNILYSTLCFLTHSRDIKIKFI